MIMNTIINIIKSYSRRVAFALTLPMIGAAGLLVTSCQDFFDVESSYIVDAGKEHLVNANDSIYSLIGVLNKVQAIADRTVLLGEARGDLVDITATTSNDLRNVANFTIDDNNKYNNPSDYYAIINNCNYYIAHVDTAKVNNRGENIFLNEYAAIKAIRAWTYLQLVLNYGKVPFVLQPIMTNEEAELDYPQYGIEQICDYFINEDGLQALADNREVTYPYYGNIKSMPSRLFYFPLNIVLGDLYLWKASFSNQQADYMEAAKRYYAYISTRNGYTTSSAYPVSGNAVTWRSTSWQETSATSWTNAFTDETNGANSEVITIIPMDSVKSEGYYSELRSIFCSNHNDNNNVDLVPSQSLKDLSSAQEYCYFDYTSLKPAIAPKGLDENRDGDLRLAAAWRTNENAVDEAGKRYTSQSIAKFLTKNGNINIYRRAQVYLRLAEALNRGGYPRLAFYILKTGLSNDVINKAVTPYLSENDSIMLNNTFRFSNNEYNAGYISADGFSAWYVKGGNTIGIHARGCGDAAYNDKYVMPVREPLTIKDGNGNEYGKSEVFVPEIGTTDPITENYIVLMDRSELKPLFVEWEANQRDWQMEKVEDLIVTEQALEMAFEGTRFYDLMRIAIRRGDNSYLANKINARRGEGKSSGVSVDLTDRHNWFLHWNGKIGY